MLVCQCNADLQRETSSQPEVDWSQAARAYPNLEEMPSFIAHQRQSIAQPAFTTTADPQQLQAKQLQAYTIVRQHMESIEPPPLRMIVSGTAGTVKSYLINCLRLLLRDKVRVVAPTGVVAFNVDGHTLLSLPTKGDYKDLSGEHLLQVQQ